MSSTNLHALLRGLDLRLEAKYNVVICVNENCRTGLQNPFRHIMNKHNHLVPTSERRNLQTILDEYICHDPPVIEEQINQVKGLRVMDGFECSSCQYVTASKGTLKHHRSVHHRGSTFSTSSASVLVQKFWKGSTYFRVNNTPNNGESNTFLQVVAQTRVQINSQPTHSIDGRYISNITSDFDFLELMKKHRSMTSFQRKYDFHACAGQYGSTLLQNLMQGVTEDQVKWNSLRNVVRSIMEEANNAIPTLHSVLAAKIYSISELVFYFSFF